MKKNSDIIRYLKSEPQVYGQIFLIVSVLLLLSACQLLSDTPTASPTLVTATFSSPPSDVAIVSPISPPPTPSSKEPDYPLSGKILFHSERNGSFDIFELDADTKEVVRLTDNPGREIEPNWSDQRKQILFAKGDQETLQLYTMDQDGKDQKALTQNKGVSLGGKWLPDQQSILYQSNKSGIFSLYLLNLSTGKEIQLTKKGQSVMPTISPDGTKVAFVVLFENEDVNGEIYVMDIKTKEIKRLTNNQGTDILPQWSPDGQKILFVSDRFGPPQLFIMNSDGTNPQAISVADNIDSYPSWAENGKAILFSSYRDDDWELYVMAADGSQQTRLTTSPGEDSYAVWIPDRQ